MILRKEYLAFARMLGYRYKRQEQNVLTGSSHTVCQMPEEEVYQIPEGWRGG